MAQALVQTLAALDRQTRITLAALLLAGLIVFLLVLTVLMSSNHSCVIVWTELNARPESLVDIPSKDLGALASFAGYLRVLPDPEKGRYKDSFLELKHKSTHLDDQSLIIETDCANLTLKMKSTRGSSFVDFIQVQLKRPDLGFAECEIHSRPTIVSKSRHHFRCSQLLVFKCFTNDRYPEAELNVQSLQFEIDGLPEMVAQGLYSTPADDCQTSQVE